MDEVMATIPQGTAGTALLEAFTAAYVKVSRERYPLKNVFVYDWEALLGQDFDEFKETKELDIGNGEKKTFRCLIFQSGNVEYSGIHDNAHVRFDGSFKIIDDKKIEFYEIEEGFPGNTQWK